MRRIVVGGDELSGMIVDEPAASVRLLLPPDGADAIVMPNWTGNQFELPGGDRAPIRTLTPRALDTDRSELTVDIVLHERGAMSDWARATAVGDEVAIAGPGRGFAINAETSSILLAGDEAAIPAIDQLLETITPSTGVVVHVEISDPSATPSLSDHPNAEVTIHELAPGRSPGDAFASAIESLDELPDELWVAGEAAAVQRVRKHLFGERGIPRSRVTARGYWKQGRSAT